MNLRFRWIVFLFLPLISLSSSASMRAPGIPDRDPHLEERRTVPDPERDEWGSSDEVPAFEEPERDPHQDDSPAWPEPADDGTDPRF